ncbi:MAG: tetratricopeptide repeat protein [Bacteroidales bacterium]|nr:tetratricopeptide repeat protein [Bacteroidales bacterium]
MKHPVINSTLFFLFLFSTININAQKSDIDSLLQVVQNAGEDTVAVNALLSLGENSSIEPQEQLIYLNKAVNLSDKLKFKTGTAKAYSILGIYYTNQGNFDKAIEYLEEASELFKELGIKDMEVATLGNTGNVHCYLGDFEKGLECFLSALDVMYELGNKSWIATAKNNIGSVYVFLDEDSLALDYYEDALSLYKEVNDESGMSLALGNMGNVYNDNKQHELAIKYYLKAVELDEKTGNIQQLALNYTNLGTAYGDIKDNKNAIKYLEKAIYGFKEIGNKNGLSITYLTLSFYFRDIGDYYSARKYLDLSFNITKEIGAKHTLMRIYEELAYHDSIDGNFVSALENYKTYSALKDTIYKSEKSEQIAEMQTKFDTEQKEKENELLKEKNTKNELLNQKKNILIFAVIGALVLMLIIGIIVVRTSRTRKKINEELKEKNFEINQQKEEITTQNEILNNQNIKIEKSHKKITDSINYASRIQKAMLPSEETINQYLPENFIFFKPRDIVSGDFYWVKKVRNHLIIVVADCTGHGVPGAMVSMLGMSLLNDIVNKENVTKASQVLEELRSGIKKSFKQTGNMDEQKDGMDLALCVINSETNVMQYSGANIPLYHYRENELLIYKPIPNPIGISYKETPFNTVEINLQKNDVFYMFSDGIVDQFHHKTNKKFKSSGLKELLNKIHQESPEYQKNKFENLYNEWTGNLNNQTDDILVMSFKII